MEKYNNFDSYLAHPKDRAYLLFLNNENIRVLKNLIVISVLIFIILFLVELFETKALSVAAVISFFNILVLIVAFFRYKKFITPLNIKRFVIYFFVSQLAIYTITNMVNYDLVKMKPIHKAETADTNVTKNSNGDTTQVTVSPKKKSNVSIGYSNTQEKKEDPTQIIFVFFVFILVFRFTRTEILQFAALSLLLPGIAELVFYQTIITSSLTPNLIFCGMFLIAALIVEARRKKKFEGDYSYMYDKHFERLRMKKELVYAQQIQLSMLPPSQAVVNGIEISARSIPATEVGGDYYDYFKIDENKTGIFICDVSGHGVASALLLSGLRSSMHIIMEDTLNPKEIFVKLNRMIRKTQPRKMFVTAVFAIIDNEKNMCELFNAGHLPPFKISGSTNELYKIKKHGITLGAMDNLGADKLYGEDQEVKISFNKGDKLIFFTDGVNEAQNEKKDEYGLDKTEIYLTANTHKKPKEIIDGLIKEVNEFAGSKIPGDDLTIIAIERIN